MPARTTRGSESMTVKAYLALRREILSCQIVPGQELSEGELASRFKMSKTPIREALAKLRTEGLVKTFPRRGYQVAPVTFQDMNELFEIRKMLEARACELAAAEITPGQLEELRTQSDIMYEPAEQPTISRFVEANRRFHETIAVSSGNARLHLLIMQVLDELQRFFHLGAKLRDVGSETSDSHRLIVDALAAREPRRAARLMVEHNDETQKGLLMALTRQTSSIMHMAVSPPTVGPSGPRPRRTARSQARATG